MCAAFQPASMIQTITITEAQVDEFQKNGVVCLRRVFGTAWLEKVARAIELARDSPGPQHWDKRTPGDTGRFFYEQCTYFRLPQIVEYVWRSPAAALAGVLMRASSVRYYSDHVLAKDPWSAFPTDWHQDQPKEPVMGSQFCSVWMPTDPVERTISLECVVGSHRWPECKTPSVVDGRMILDRDFPRLPRIARRRTDFDIVTFDLEPGDCIVFHCNTAHGAAGNLTDQRRWVLSTRWVGDDARYRSSKPGSGIPGDVPWWLRDGMKFRGKRFPKVWTAARGLAPCLPRSTWTRFPSDDPASGFWGSRRASRRWTSATSPLSAAPVPIRKVSER